MEDIKLGSGDIDTSSISKLTYVDQISDDKENGKTSKLEYLPQVVDIDVENEMHEITPQIIDDNENKLKERIAQCKSIIESLKIELTEEKSKIDKQNKIAQHPVKRNDNYTSSRQVCTSHSFIEDISYNAAIYSDCVYSKLSSDYNLIEYEKQLQRYQNTLNMAQIEKKNAIRKQMLAKAYRLKLLEVENQCNIELLRVKQSLQCLEPLKIIASKWRNNSDHMYDGNSYELMPRYPELYADLNCDLNVNGNMLDIKLDCENGEVTKDN